MEKSIKKILDIWLPIRISQQRIPGMTICISSNGKILYEKGFGVANIEQKASMKADALFRVASMSKMFTAVSVLQLVEKNKIKLN